MPYDSGGNFSLVPSYKAIAGQTIRTEQHNPPLEDIASGMSSVLVRDGRNGMVGPLSMGGFNITNVSAGTNTTDAATVGQVQGAMPIGAIIDFAGASAPAGWLLCFGQAVSRTTYGDLFAVIGETYGAGDGSTTFNTPDLRGRAVAGRDNMGGTSANRLTNQDGGLNGDILGAAGGAETHALTETQNAAHTHAAGTLVASSAGSHTHTAIVRSAGNQSARIGSSGADPAFTGTDTTSINSGGEHTHTVTGSTASAGTGSAHNNVQPTIILNKIIRTGV